MAIAKRKTEKNTKKIVKTAVKKKTTSKALKALPKTVSPVPALTVQKIAKRDGRVVSFDEKKILKAVEKAFLATGEGKLSDAIRVAGKVVSLMNKKFKGTIPKIEDVQDLVEHVLMVLDYEETAKSYILYREQRRRTREMEKSLDDSADLVDKYIGEMDWKVKENANMSYSLQGMNIISRRLSRRSTG